MHTYGLPHENTNNELGGGVRWEMVAMGKFTRSLIGDLHFVFIGQKRWVLAGIEGVRRSRQEVLVDSYDRGIARWKQEIFKSSLQILHDFAYVSLKNLVAN